jgi:hypothetical protein
MRRDDARTVPPRLAGLFDVLLVAALAGFRQLSGIRHRHRQNGSGVAASRTATLTVTSKLDVDVIR